MIRIKSKVGPTGQTVIPKPVRDQLGILPGDEVYFTVHKDHAHIEKRAGDEWDAFYARMPILNLPPEFDADAILGEEIVADSSDESP